MRNTMKLALASTALTMITGAAMAQNEGAIPASLSQHLTDDDKIVWGGGAKESSSYSGKIVPVVIEKLDEVQMSGYTWGGPSDGSAMNAMKVTVNPTHLALCQADICSRLKGEPIPGTSWTYQFTVVQEDVADECLYMFTKSPNFTTWGHIVENAWDISIATGSELSGSYGTLTMNLMERYPALSDIEVINAGGGTAIVQAVLDDVASFGFIVMRPDPENAVFEMINDNDLHLVPVIDFDLEDLYTFKSLKVSNSTWGGFGAEAKYHETACTEVQVITGDPAMLSDAQSRSQRRLEATIERVEGRIDGAEFKQDVVAQFTSWKDYLDSVRDISGEKLQDLLEASKEKIESMGG